jgi:hypothetical protein
LSLGFFGISGSSLEKVTLILILRMGKKDYESFRKEADSIFNVASWPEQPKRSVGGVVGTI